MNRTVKFIGVRFLRWICDDWYSERRKEKKKNEKRKRHKKEKWISD